MSNAGMSEGRARGGGIGSAEDVDEVKGGKAAGGGHAAVSVVDEGVADAQQKNCQVSVATSP
ncbi:hypothetical protein FRC12_018618 [Ceratobasidium sp. 428]|nr:hypothetical protein FRC12_018618 [Ceratobasidium sp. 428]